MLISQVKVWFQNRRTKYKRAKTDEDDDPNLDQSAEERDNDLQPGPGHDTPAGVHDDVTIRQLTDVPARPPNDVISPDRQAISKETSTNTKNAADLPARQKRVIISSNGNSSSESRDAEVEFGTGTNPNRAGLITLSHGSVIVSPQSRSFESAHSSGGYVPPPPPTKKSKTMHHVNRWRADTNQI